MSEEDNINVTAEAVALANNNDTTRRFQCFKYRDLDHFVQVVLHVYQLSPNKINPNVLSMYQNL